MDTSAYFAFLAAALMGVPSFLIAVYPEMFVSHLSLRIGALLLFGAGLSALLLQGVFLKKERVRGELRVAAREAESARRFDELAALLREQESAPPRSPSQPVSLKARAQQLADDLFAFLRKQGPQPPTPLSVKGSAAEQREAFNTYFDWKGTIYRHYMAYFRDRVVQIDRELAAHGVFTKLDMREIDPPETTGEVDLRKIAETLLLAAHQMPDA